jgi:hypothetical protein
MRQQFRLGRRLRDRYVHGTPALLSQPINFGEVDEILCEFTELQIYVRSTDVNRTLASAMANMAGFVPFPIYHVLPDLIQACSVMADLESTTRKPRTRTNGRPPGHRFPFIPSISKPIT